MRRPNLLLVHADQHRHDCVGAHGHPLLRTPALDRLAAAGYRHAWIGKFHRELTGLPTDHGAALHVDPSAYPAWRAARRLPPEPREGGWFGCVDLACPPEATRLAWMADHVIAELEHAATRPDEPFFLRCDPPEPHLPCRPSAAFAALFPPAAIAPWPSWPDRQPGKPAAQLRQKRLWGVADWTWEQWQPVVARYLAVIAELDHQLDRILQTLDSLGLAENTLVAYTADHGDYCGGHGQMDKHFALYDDLVRVPLLLRWPGHVPAGARPSAFVCNELDLARTLLAAAELKAPPSFVGQDLLALLRGDSPPRDHAFAQYFGTESGSTSLRMLRTADWKYVYHPTGDTDELYDLAADPAEQVNLVAAPAHAETLRTLRARLAAAMEEARDPLLNPWTRVELLAAPPVASRP